MLYIISLIFIIIALLLMIINFLVLNLDNNKPLNKNKTFNFCVLIPARDESKVIESLFKSLKDQTLKVDMNNVYVIVESENDPTNKIAQKYGINVFIRKKLNLKRKGYALDEVVQEIVKTKKYDAYFIFDADNILENNYFEEMKQTYLEGYDIGISYRNSKNGNADVTAACSSLTFSLINTLDNRNRVKHTSNVLISGTGFYIAGKYIDEWKSYSFNTLTEDYELSLYAILNGLTCYYNTKAVFYDEQPTHMSESIKQRIRWIKGYFESRKKYIHLIYKSIFKKSNNLGSKINICIGVLPYITIIIGYILLLIKLIIDKQHFMIIYSLLFIYLVLVIVTAIIIILENKRINLSLKTKIKCLFFNPLFLISYVACAIKALLTRDVKWDKIDHNTKNIK